ncbi:hypothetical protein [Salisediminibacterium beveridgei]|nr:hypothetical protein [Salisediminibacterium beveridgei]
MHEKDGLIYCITPSAIPHQKRLRIVYENKRLALLDTDAPNGGTA